MVKRAFLVAFLTVAFTVGSRPAHAASIVLSPDGSYASDFGATVGPIWQFTTTTPLNVRRTTWGAIKAMYR